MNQHIKNDKCCNTPNQKCSNCPNKCQHPVNSKIRTDINEIIFDKDKKAVMRMRRKAFDKAMFSICSRPPESGGLWIGPVGTYEITDFYFDSGGTFSSASYSPDHVTLNRKLKEEWVPMGLEFFGFCHSHPRCLDWPTMEDVVYIKRLLKINPEMLMFFAPIIIPSEFRMRPAVVFRNNPDKVVEAKIEFFE